MKSELKLRVAIAQYKRASTFLVAYLAATVIIIPIQFGWTSFFVIRKPNMHALVAIGLFPNAHHILLAISVFNLLKAMQFATSQE